MSPETPTDEKLHSLAELCGIHKGRMGFVLGNGWSATYYDINKLKNDGILIGCNKGFRRFPLDYLVWQDGSVDKECIQFKGPKITSHRKNRAHMARPSLFFHGFSKLSATKSQPGNVRLMHSGGIALQVAIKLGCNPIVLVGCDCRMFKVDGQDVKFGGYKSNVFEDKQLRYFQGSKKKELLLEKPSTNHLQSFMKKFEQLYQHYKNDVDIYMLGPWSISNTIPWVEWPQYWSDSHPERK
jgi:hypothetical protein